MAYMDKALFTIGDWNVLLVFWKASRMGSQREATYITAIGIVLDDTQNFPRQFGVPKRVRHLLRICWFLDDGLDILFGFLLEIFLLRVTLSFQANRRRTTGLKIDSIRPIRHIPVLKYIWCLGSEKLGRDRKRSVEPWTREQLDVAWPLQTINDKPINILADETSHLLFLEVAADKFREQDR